MIKHPFSFPRVVSVACTLALTVVTLCMVSPPGLAADAPPLQPSHAHENLKNLRLAEEYVTKAEAALKAQDHGTKDQVEIAQQYLRGELAGLAEARSFAGEPVGAIDAFDRKSHLQEQVFGSSTVSDPRADLKAIDESRATDAITTIVQAAKNRQVVILNEAHHVEFDRVFAMRLAKKLRKIGYEYLACETFSIDDNHVLSKGYVTNETGVYSVQPMYVNFLTDAMADGWKFVSYEPDDEPREYGMAVNLVERIFKKSPSAKVFIYVGYSHAKKLPVSQTNSDASKMAAQLKRLTGIDPLTINQTTLYAHYDTAQQARYYEHAARKMHGRTTPAVIVMSNGKGVKLGIDDFAYDLEVVHPQYAMEAVTMRPEWMSLTALGNLKPQDIPVDLLPKTGRRLIYAYRVNSPIDAAPFDIVMVKAGEPAPKLMLPEGHFALEYED
jgi:hypothetical protein